MLRGAMQYPRTQRPWKNELNWRNEIGYKDFRDDSHSASQKLFERGSTRAVGQSRVAKSYLGLDCDCQGTYRANGNDAGKNT